jgi:basic membrane lipoprotein Med (substrate-binding protein (PBP1-ABC) superfamily)
MRLKKFAAVLLALAAFCLFAASLGAPSAQAAGKKLRVAFLLYESIDDQGWNAAHHAGMMHLKKQLGSQVEIAFTENVADSEHAERVLRDYAGKDFDLIFGTTVEYAEPIYKVSGEFSKVRFMHCSGARTRPNLGSYVVRIEQAEYLAGYMAGLMGFKNVGTVATLPIPDVVRGVNAFTLGLLRGLNESKTPHDPAKVNTVVWLNTWRDAKNENALAERLAVSGHDLIREMADTSDSSKAACRMGVPTIGYATDSRKAGAECALTSTTFEWGRLYVDVVKSVLAGTWKSQELYAGFEAGGVGLAPFGEAVPKAVAAKVLALKAKMAKGRDMSFAGPIVDQAGVERIGKGAKASDKELLSMNWFVRGVSGTLPK